MGRTACTEPQCLYKCALYLTVELYLYSPCGPYGLYRASVPVQGCTLPYSRAILLLPLWALRPVQSLSACTRVHFTLPSFIPVPWPDKRWVRDEVVWHRRRDKAVPGYSYSVLQYSFIHYESHMKLHRTETENSCKRPASKRLNDRIAGLWQDR